MLWHSERSQIINFTFSKNKLFFKAVLVFVNSYDSFAARDSSHPDLYRTFIRILLNNI